MNRLPLELRVRVLSALVEGNSIRATARMVGVSKDTVQKLLEDVGAACELYHDENVRDLSVMLIQCDEIWTFCKAKESNIKPAKKRETIGDMWTWTAMDSQRKLVITWTLGKRTPRFARRFMEDLSGRVKTIVQISTDGFGCYKEQIQRYFGKRADYGMDVKTYGRDMETVETRYSPPKVIERRLIRVLGVPDERYISTSHIERQNLTMRMSMRRFTRLTNGFSKKMANLQCALALHYMHYNFCRVHSTLKTTPAIASNLTDRIWTLHDLANLPDLMRGEAAA
ncbi:MAG: IS1 family transposase [Candidatus Tyrphobacter sp.]